MHTEQYLTKHRMEEKDKFGVVSDPDCVRNLGKIKLSHKQRKMIYLIAIILAPILIKWL